MASTSSSSSEENLTTVGNGGESGDGGKLAESKLQCECEDEESDAQSDAGPGAPQPGPSAAGGSSGAQGGVESAMDRLFLQHRNEIMFELRRLKMGDRPVTGQGNREVVADFLNRNFNEQEHPRTEQCRPEAVIVEVQGLVERRPVSSLLQSAQFRRQLEGALRDSVRTVSARHHALAAGNASRASGNASRASGNASSSPSVSSQNPSPQTSSGTDAIQNQLPPPPAERAASWLEQHVPVATNAHSRESWQQQQYGPSALEVMQQMQRDEIIGDISELLQRQLVSDTLDSPFRDTLETRVLPSRLSETGTNGRQVEEFVQSLPRGRVTRNDFSHLNLPGPMPAAAEALSDTMSVISATAAVHVTQSQSNTVMSREITALKSQMRELQNMMRLSFDLQLDIQRSIRQEVSAALSGGAVGGGATATPLVVNRPLDDTHCLICLDRNADSVMYQCGHICVCYTCGLTLKARGHHCPVCRAPIKDIIRAYRSNELP